MMSHTEGEAFTSQQDTVSKRGSQVTSERVALLVLSALLVAAAIIIYRVSSDNMQTKKSFQTLKAEHEAMRTIFTERLSEKNMVPLSCPKPPEINENDPCPKCDQGWVPHLGKCYYFPTEYLSWEESRQICQNRGGDLVKIDSKEEQTFLQKELSDKMRNYDDKFWIGLTDSKEENEWFWVDGSPLNTRLSFWSAHEPDDWKEENPDGEDCVRMGTKGAAEELNSWSDKSCKHAYRSICEKQTRVRRVVCF